MNFNCFLNTFIYCFETIFPLKSKCFRNTPIRKAKFSNNLLKKLDTLGSLNVLRKNNNSLYLNNYYKVLKKSINKQVQQEKRIHLTNMTENSSNKSKTLWKLVNTKLGLGNCNKPCSQLKVNDLTSNTPQGIGNHFGNYFSTIVKNNLNLHFIILHISDVYCFK